MPRGRPPRPLDPKEVIRLYLEGVSLRQIQRQLGVAYPRVRAAITDAGIEVHNGGRYGEAHGRWKGGRSIDARHGYVRVTLSPDDPFRIDADSNGQMYEHRLVMMRALGRTLERWETVHHIDGNRSNNVLENLQLRFGQHGPGVILTCRNCGSHDIKHEGFPDGD